MPLDGEIKVENGKEYRWTEIYCDCCGHDDSYWSEVKPPHPDDCKCFGGIACWNKLMAEIWRPEDIEKQFNRSSQLLDLLEK